MMAVMGNIDNHVILHFRIFLTRKAPFIHVLCLNRYGSECGYEKQERLQCGARC